MREDAAVGLCGLPDQVAERAVRVDAVHGDCARKVEGGQQIPAGGIDAAMDRARPPARGGGGGGVKQKARAERRVGGNPPGPPFFKNRIEVRVGHRLNLRISPNDGFQLRAFPVMFAPALNDAQELGMFSQKPHQIVSLATLYRMTIVVEGPKHHLHRDPFQRFAQDLRDLLANRQQDSIKSSVA